MDQTYISSCYCTNLRRSANMISDFYDGALKPSGVTVAQYYLLINLSRLKSANISRWARQVGLDRSTLVRNIKPLEARELIKITDGSGKTYTLTENGSQVLQAAMPLWQSAQDRIAGVLGGEDVEAILRINEKLQKLQK